jgi:hypothetical protein
MNPLTRSLNLLLGAAVLTLSLQSIAAEPAKPVSGAGNAGIIVLDGKTPPGENGAKVSTGIGLGGCAACDKPGADAKTDAAKLKGATKVAPNTSAR